MNMALGNTIWIWHWVYGYGIGYMDMALGITFLNLLYR